MRASTRGLVVMRVALSSAALPRRHTAATLHSASRSGIRAPIPVDSSRATSMSSTSTSGNFKSGDNTHNEAMEKNESAVGESVDQGVQKIKRKATEAAEQARNTAHHVKDSVKQGVSQVDREAQGVAHRVENDASANSRHATSHARKINERSTTEGSTRQFSTNAQQAKTEVKRQGQHVAEAVRHNMNEVKIDANASASQAVEGLKKAATADQDAHKVATEPYGNAGHAAHQTQTAGQSASEAARSTMEGAKSTVKQATSAIGETLSSAFQQVKQAASKAGETASELKETASKKMSNLGDRASDAGKKLEKKMEKIGDDMIKSGEEIERRNQMSDDVGITVAGKEKSAVRSSMTDGSVVPPVNPVDKPTSPA